MSAVSGYRIADEPRPGARAHLAVNPIWPFFGFMFGGTWLSWPWFILNGFIIGSPTRKKEIGLTVVGLVGAVALFLLFGVLLQAEVLTPEAGPYALLVMMLWKIGITYGLYSLQAKTFDIYEYYGGRVQNGFFVLFVAYFLWMNIGPKLQSASPFSALILR